MTAVPKPTPRIKKQYRIPKVGKRDKAWKHFRDTVVYPYWETLPQPLICGICHLPIFGRAVPDHIKNRGSHPELALVLSNIQPSHWICNSRKASGLND